MDQPRQRLTCNSCGHPYYIAWEFVKDTAYYQFYEEKYEPSRVLTRCPLCKDDLIGIAEREALDREP
jgi:hypothetical protein